MIDRLPPQNADAEQAVLGSLLIDARALSDVMEILAPEHFYDRRHGLIYQAMLDLFGRGEKPDVVTVASELNSHLDEAGGAGYLSQLGLSAPTSIHVEHYAEIIIQKATNRALIGAAGRIAAIGYEDGSDVQEALERAQLELGAIFAKATMARTKFAKAGFRSYALAAPNESWRLVLSRVDVNERDPKGLITVYTPDHPAAQSELDGYVFCRNVGLFGGTNLGGLSKELAKRLGDTEAVWAKRLDYLAQRTIREAQASAETSAMEATPDRPTGNPWLFRGRMRLGRTISMFGPGSAGKTTLSTGLILSACTGLEVVPNWIPAGSFISGLLDWDEGQEENDIRMHAMCNAYRVDISGFHYRRMARPLVDCADDVGKWIVDNRIEFLVVSPVSRAIREKQGDPAAPIHELYEVLREFATTNLLIAHVVGSAIDPERQASREYGSVAQMNDARGSYSVYEQSQEPGRRVVVLRNTKPDMLSPKMDPQAVRIEFEPPYQDESGAYDTIKFGEDVILEKGTTRSEPREGQLERFVRLVKESQPIPTVDLAYKSGFSEVYIRQLAVRARKKNLAQITCGKAGWYIESDMESDE